MNKEQANLRTQEIFRRSDVYLKCLKEIEKQIRKGNFHCTVKFEGIEGLQLSRFLQHYEDYSVVVNIGTKSMEISWR